MSDDKEITPQYLWEELHVRQGDSLKAALLAFGQIEGLYPAEVPQEEWVQAEAEKLYEFGRIAVVTALSAVEEESDPEQAKALLDHALTVLLAAYPLAVSPEKAEKKAQYLDLSDKITDRIIYLRDTVKLLEVLQILLPEDQELTSLMGGVCQLTAELADDREDRFALIYLMERGDYDQATEAYQQFLEMYGLGSEIQDNDQIITVSARMMGRAVDEGDVSQIERCISNIRRVCDQDASLAKFAIDEIEANSSAQSKQAKLQEKIRQRLAGFEGLVEEPNETVFQDLLAQLKQAQYIRLADEIRQVGQD